MAAALWLLVAAGGAVRSEALLVTSPRGPWEPEAREVLEVDPDEEDGLGLGYDGDGAEDHALDWQVSEMVRELYPMEVPPARSVAAWRDANVSFASSWAREIPEHVRWHYGTHHKAGTVMTAGLAFNQATFLEQTPFCLCGYRPKGCGTVLQGAMRVWVWCNLTRPLVEGIGRGDWSPFASSNDGLQLRSNELARPARPTVSRAVHLIRDPLAMVVSGYIYHKKKSDDTPACLGNRSMSGPDALAAEASFVLNATGKEMLRAYQNSPPWLLQVRFESFTESIKSFDATADVVYQHMLGGMLPPIQLKKLMKRTWFWDLRRNSPADKAHVASAVDKERVMQALNGIPADLLRQLREMRGSLGYGQPRPEAAE